MQARRQRRSFLRGACAECAPTLLLPARRQRPLQPLQHQGLVSHSPEDLLSDVGGKQRQAQVAEGSDQLSGAREALMEAESALRQGDWDTFGAAMQRLKHLLGE